MSRTKKKAYTGSKRFDVTCRNHGACSYCRDNRLHKHKKELGRSIRELATESVLKTDEL